MAREPRRSGGERIRYGICLNDDCAKCKSKEVQQVSMRKDFVCSECGSELRECPAPKTKSKTPIIIAAALGATLLCGGYYLLAVGNEEPEIVNENPEEDEGIDTTTIVTEPEPESVEDTIKESPKEAVEEPVTPANPTYGTVNLGYGTYTGDLKNGQPHGHGTIKYTKQHQIVSSKSEYIASPGDEYEGDFRNGTVSGNIGHWSHNGTVTAIKP